MPAIINAKLDELQKICNELKVKKLYVFGSVVDAARFDDRSDIDFLISFDDDLRPEVYSENYFELHDRLSALFKRKVDLVTERSLANPYFIEGLNKHKILVYEA
jgi:uncharacterized protein